MLAFDRSPEWMGDLAVRGEYTSEVHTLDDKFKVGATGYSSTHSGRGGNFEITESLKHEKMTSRVTSGMMFAIGTFSLEPMDEGTVVNYVLDYRFNSFLWRIFDKLFVKRMMEKDYDKALDNLKSNLEK